MAVSLNDIKNKIASTKNTSQITNAMQMVSAAKLGKSEEAAKNFQVYAQKVRKLVTDMLHGHETENARHHSMLISRPVKKSAPTLPIQMTSKSSPSSSMKDCAACSLEIN